MFTFGDARFLGSTGGTRLNQPIVTMAGGVAARAHVGRAGGLVGQTSKLTDQGRLRSPVLGPDGALYVTSSNGGDTDKVLRVAATAG